jgi:LacI family transcriptional regulator
VPAPRSRTTRATRATLADVAASAGVSPSTVSRVLHGGAGVREELAVRVRADAEALGYTVNRQARSLRRGRDEAIGIAVEDFTIPFFGRIVSVVERAAHERGYGVLITCAGSGRSEEEAVASLLGRGVAGLLVASGTSGAPEGYLDDVAREVPLVQVDAPGPSAVADTVGIDNAAAGRAVTEHLLDHGHERILFVGSGPAARTVALRREGYEQAMRRAGLAPRVAWLGYDPGGVRERALAVLGEQADLTAVLSSVARTTMGLLSAIATLQRRDLAVIAIDDLAGADAMTPGLTVLEQDAEAIGARAVSLLFDRVDGRAGAPQHVHVGLTLVPRGSGELRPAPPPAAPAPRPPGPAGAAPSEASSRPRGRGDHPRRMRTPWMHDGVF